MEINLIPEIRKTVSRAGNLRDSIILMILGALTVGSFFFFFTSVQTEYGWWFYADGTPMRRAYSIYSPIAGWILLYLFSALAIFICGIIQTITTLRRSSGETENHLFKRLAIIQIGLGVLVVASLIWYLAWLEPNWRPEFTFFGSDNSKLVLHHSAGWLKLLIAWKVATFVLGLVVIGLGLGRLTKIRQTAKRRIAFSLAILSLFILGSIYFYATVVSGGYDKAEGFDPSRNLNVIEFGLHAPNILLTTWNWLYVALGLVIFGSSLVQLILAVRHPTESTKYRILSLVQIGQGIIFLAWLFWYVVWLEPYWGPYYRPVEPGGTSIIFLHNSSWIGLMTSWKAASFSLCVAVVGLNIGNSTTHI